MPDSVIDLARDAVAGLQRSGDRRCIIGITGPPGAGKSTLVEALIRACKDEFGERRVAGLPMDGFHLTNRQLAAAGLEDRKGAPETFDADSFVSALRHLAEPGIPALAWPKYSRRLHEPVSDAIEISSTERLVFVEGNYLLLQDEPWKSAREIFASVWYVAADIAAIKTRLRQRQLEGGRTAADADQHVLQSDLVNATRVEATKSLADRVVQVSPADPMLSGLQDPATGRPIVLD